MSRIYSVTKRGWMCGIAAALLCCLSSGIAAAQSVQGSGIQRFLSGAVDGANYFREVSVNAWVDEDGVAHGTMAWRGDVIQFLPGGGIGYGGPADPYIFDVTDIVVVGNTALVEGILIAAPQFSGNGGYFSFAFTDNEETGSPDELDGSPIDAGNYVVGN